MKALASDPHKFGICTSNNVSIGLTKQSRKCMKTSVKHLKTNGKILKLYLNAWALLHVALM